MGQFPHLLSPYIPYLQPLTPDANRHGICTSPVRRTMKHPLTGTTQKGTRMKKALVALALAAVASSAQAIIAAGSHDMTTNGGTLSACW